MDRRKFLEVSGWSLLGIAASGSLLGSCTPGSKEAKRIMPSKSPYKMFWGDLHNHCNLTRCIRSSQDTAGFCKCYTTCYVA